MRRVHHLLACCFYLLSAMTVSGQDAEIRITPQSEKQQSGFLAGDVKMLSGKVDQYVKHYVDLEIFSGVVLLADRGEVFYEKAFGLANREEGIPNKTATKFNIGSMNKSFTAVIVGQLIAEGKLELGTKLVSILDGFEQRDIDRVTVEHLLSHTSGFGDYYSPGFEERDGLENNHHEMLTYIRTLPLHFEPGSEQMYSNAGYFLLGAMIVSVTGKSFADNITERIIEPLQMDDTYVKHINAIPERSVGYMISTTGEVMDNRRWEHEPNPSGGFWSTARDVLTFYQHFFYSDKLLSSDARSRLPFFQMIAPFYTHQRAAIPLAGGSNGINTVIYEMLGERISIIVFANMDEPVAEQVGLGILNIVRGDEPEPAMLPAHMNVYRAYREYGTRYVAEHFAELSRNFHPDDPKDLILNRAGYDLLSAGDVKAAIDLFTLNTELFPDIANCHDSLGEAYYRKGDYQEAKKCYLRALEIRPDLQSAIDMLNRMEK